MLVILEDDLIVMVFVELKGVILGSNKMNGSGGGGRVLVDYYYGIVMFVFGGRLGVMSVSGNSVVVVVMRGMLLLSYD